MYFIDRENTSRASVVFPLAAVSCVDRSKFCVGKILSTMNGLNDAMRMFEALISDTKYILCVCADLLVCKPERKGRLVSSGVVE